MFGRQKRKLNAESSPESPHTNGVKAAATFRLTVSFMLAVVLVFVAVEGWRTWRDYCSAFASARNTVSNLARATGQHAEDTIRQVDVLTAALRERIEGDGLHRLNVLRTRELLAQQINIMPQLHGLFVFGPKGEWVVTNRDFFPTPPNNADRNYFQYHKTHNDRAIRIGDVIKSRSTGDLIIPISRRLNNPDGSFAGVLLGTINVSYFVDYYGDFKIDDKGVLVLATREGTILVRRPFVDSMIGTSLAQSTIYKDFLPQTNVGVVEAKAVTDSTERLYGYRALTAYPLVVEAGLSRESITAIWRGDLVKNGFVLFLLITMLSVFGLTVLSQLRQRMLMERELRHAHQTMRDMALTDSLTGIGNRRRLDNALVDELRLAKRSGSSLSLIMLDIDYFKRYNDKYGHAGGDDCLSAVACAVQKMVKRPGDLAVRYGGEEFTVLLPNTDQLGAEQITQNILDAIRSLRIEHSEHPLGYITASAGVTTRLPSDVDISSASLLRFADIGLYEAKRNGRNRWCFHRSESDVAV